MLGMDLDGFICWALSYFYELRRWQFMTAHPPFEQEEGFHTRMCYAVRCYISSGSANTKRPL